MFSRKPRKWYLVDKENKKRIKECQFKFFHFCKSSIIAYSRIDIGENIFYGENYDSRLEARKHPSSS